MRRLATTFVLVFIAWLALTFSLRPENVLAGTAVSLAITLVCRHFLSRDTPRIILHPVKWFWMVVYAAVLAYAEVLAHMDVAGRIITGRVRPAIVEVPVGFGSLLGKTLLGNSITLTPGTLTVNTGDEEKFYVHALAYRKDAEIGRLFRRFGLRVIS